MKTNLSTDDQMAWEKICLMAGENSLDILGGKIRRTSSRLCLGVEHGDYNGTELFGVGTDRFIWFGYKPNGTNRVRLFSGNFPDEGVIEINPGEVPAPKAPSLSNSWARFPFGVSYILAKEGFNITEGIDGVILGNIPGGGMSRSASLCLNLILSLLEVNGIEVSDPFKIVELAQAVENEYIGSPCGQLDQIMILFAREGMGTHYNPETRAINYVPLGEKATDFRFVVLDTATVRPGLEKSTYKIRKAECDEFAALLHENDKNISRLADIRDQELYHKIINQWVLKKPHLCARLNYIFHAQKRFSEMLEAWKNGDIKTVGRVFREDGIGLRDDYKISGPELETMCDIARTVPGVLGERMLGGGDKGAAGALVQTKSVESLKRAVDVGYPRSHPMYANQYAVHVCKIVDGLKVFEGLG